MNEEKGRYVIVSNYNHYCIIADGLEKDAIETAKTMKQIEKDNNPRIFKIEKEIYWQEKGREEITEKRIIPDSRSFGGSATDF